MSPPQSVRHAICGVRRSARAVRLTSMMLQQGLKPEYLLIVDDSATNIANTLTLLHTSRGFPFWNGVWDRSFSSHACLVSLGLLHQIPFYCFPSFASQAGHALLQTRRVDVVVHTDAPNVTGAFLHLPTYGVLSVHPASLPYFRGDWATALNLYLNEPLVASAFFMTPRSHDGAIVGRAPIPVYQGDQVDHVIQRAVGVSAELVAQVLRALETRSVEFRRQQPWQGVTCRSSHSPEGARQPAMPAKLQIELADRLAKHSYGHYENDRA